MKEEWKLIEEITKKKPKGKYYISNKGRLYSSFTKKILKHQLDHKGYHYIEIGDTKIKVHRLVAKYFIDNPNNYEQVNHIDCDKGNNEVNNLEWCSNRYNYEYSLKCGTFSKEFLKYKGNPKLIQEQRIKKLLK